LAVTLLPQPVRGYVQMYSLLVWYRNGISAALGYGQCGCTCCVTIVRPEHYDLPIIIVGA